MAFFLEMDFIDKNIENYSLEFTENESDLLKSLNRETNANVLNSRMLSGHLQGRFLSFLSNMIQPLNILEIGTYTGYSALCLSEGLKKEGYLHTIDINDEYASIANKYFLKSKWKNNIKQHIGNALKILPNIDYSFQLAFIDADKENYIKYFKLLFNKIDVGGYIVADNVLWSGKVLNDKKDSDTKALHDYNNYVNSLENVRSILLPIRDGLMITQKIK